MQQADFEIIVNSNNNIMMLFGRPGTANNDLPWDCLASADEFEIIFNNLNSAYSIITSYLLPEDEGIDYEIGYSIDGTSEKNTLIMTCYSENITFLFNKKKLKEEVALAMLKTGAQINNH